MEVKFQNFLAIIILSIVGLFGLADFVYGDTKTGDINIQMLVVEPPGEPGPGAGDSAPVISNVTSTPSATSSATTWTITDDNGLSSVIFSYGMDLAYSSTSSIIGTYGVNLTGLTPDTVYYFRILVVDIASNIAQYTGSFTTLADKVKSLKIIAKPEKRVFKPGGNLDLDVTVLFYDPAIEQVVHMLNTSLDKSGSSTLYQLVMPTGNNLQVILKGQSHLAKKIVGVNIANGQDIILDFTDGGYFELLAGDVQGTGLKDNFIDILDLAAEDVKFNANYLNEDLNRDGIVDVLDLSIILVNYNQQGDPIPAI